MNPAWPLSGGEILHITGGALHHCVLELHSLTFNYSTEFTRHINLAEKTAQYYHCVAIILYHLGINQLLEN